MNQLEIDVTEWLLAHKTGLQDEITSKHISHYHLFPNALYDLYDDLYADAALDLLKKKVMDSFNLSYEQIELFFNRNYIIIALGNEILKPPKEKYGK